MPSPSPKTIRLILAAAMLLAGCQSTSLPAVTVASTGGAAVAPAAAQGVSFADWVAALRAEALGQGIRAATFDRAFANVRLSDRIVDLDSSQPEFVRPVWAYLDSAVSDRRVQQGRDKLEQHASVLRRVAHKYGVSPEILVAFWGIETDFGRDTGGFAVVDALSTLAYKTRRAQYFRGELLAALRILDTGDISVERMKGSWAGAMGQTQFMPSVFLKHAVDEDGDGRRDIWDSFPDVFASTARFVHANGWRADQRWGEEVRLPPGFPYDQAEQTIVKPVAEWRRMGVRPMAGGELSGDGMAAILVLAGHTGPAFLARGNFDAIMKYNPSTSYALAVALLADRISGRPGVTASWPRQEAGLSRDERMELQQRLVTLGIDPGGVDGIFGANTRTALRRFQKAAGEIPDGFATRAILERLRQSTRTAAETR
jgi:lytic murein transglycosylase